MPYIRYSGEETANPTTSNVEYEGEPSHPLDRLPRLIQSIL